MRWETGRRSENVEDVRGARRGPVMIGGGFGLLVIIVLALLFGADPAQLLQQVGNPQQGAQQQERAPDDPETKRMMEFVSVVLADTEDVWTELFRRSGRQYEAPKLRVFDGTVQSACGFANAAVGPFYCPRDQIVYLDLSFFQELDQRFGAPGDFAQAYVIAHEIGHHVQNQLGTMDEIDALRARMTKEEANELSVRLELQADFLAGVWAHHAQKARHILESGDVEEALEAANAIGDDRLQMQSQGYVVPDAFTHGTSAQRAKWFRRGLQTGDLSQGDTFNTDSL